MSKTKYSPYEVRDRCWVEEDFTAWYQLFNERKKGPWRDIIQAKIEMDKAMAERAKRVTMDELLDEAERLWKEKKAKINKNIAKKRERQRRKDHPV